MPYNGVGVFQRVYQWVTDAANGVFVDATRTDTDSNDIAAGLTNCVTRDGQSPWLANLPAGGFKVTGLANGSNPTDSTNYGQVFNSAAFTSPTIVTDPVPTDNSSRIPSTRWVNQVAFSTALPAQSLGFLRSDGTTTGFTQTHTGYAQNEVKGADIASAATINLTTATGNFTHVTGTTTITAITIPVGADRTVVFDGILTLTHNATTLILPSGENITTAAGDSMVVRGDTGGARVIEYQRASGDPVLNRFQTVISTSQIDKTSDITLADIPGLSVNLVAGKTYRFEIKLYPTSGAGGVNIGFAGTATATSFVAAAQYSIAGSGLVTVRTTSATGALGGASVGVIAEISGTFVVNAAGTFKIQFAQNSSSAATSSILINSTLSIERIN